MVYLAHRADVGLSHPHVARGMGGSQQRRFVGRTPLETLRSPPELLEMNAAVEKPLQDKEVG